MKRIDLTYLGDSHLGAPANASKGHEGRYEASVHLIEDYVRASDINEVFVGLVLLIDVKELVKATRNDLSRGLIEDDTAALSSVRENEERNGNR